MKIRIFTVCLIAVPIILTLFVLIYTRTSKKDFGSYADNNTNEISYVQYKDLQVNSDISYDEELFTYISNNNLTGYLNFHDNVTYDEDSLVGWSSLLDEYKPSEYWTISNTDEDKTYIIIKVDGKFTHELAAW